VTVSDLPKTYDPKSVEPRLYKRWEEAGVFHEEPDPARPPFIICMPPPNVTARAHIGHGSTFTPMDILTRYHRMLGENADWLPGTDHAAIATEAVLVRQLAAEGKSRESLGRQAYLRLAWEWAQQTGGTIFEQFRAVGFGPDWQRDRFTMDEGLSAAVRKVFVDLYREGLVYRGKRLINWDPKARSTVSDAEVEHEERDAFLWRIKYPSIPQGDKGGPQGDKGGPQGDKGGPQGDKGGPQGDKGGPPGHKGGPGGGNGGIEVATTRPETMLGDVAIAVHPDDERYKHLIGKTVLLPPLLQREIPIIADESVESEFGTGAVKVTPAHDPTDYEIGLRHNLEMPSILDLDARVSGAEREVGKYDGMDRYEARKAILADLRKHGLLIEEKPYRHAVSISDRTGEVIEPLLSLQWFVKMKPLAQAALQAHREGRVRFVPERYGTIFEQWLENIRDWNISRQVWWGHQLPVWYTQDGDVVVAETEEEALKLSSQQYGTPELTRDPDTLDTWFSSGLWPFSILGWPKKTPELEHWYPSQVLITGYEIIFLWVARMVMLGLKFMGDVPFRDVCITPLVFDAIGRKMSKSLGNAIDPMDLVEKYGADAFRMGMMRQIRLESQEVRFQESRCEEARNFNNKIWNATRFALCLPEGLPQAMTLPRTERMTIADKWILTRLHDTAKAVSDAFDAYDFGAAAETLWRFVWYELCDWYLESTKDEFARETRAAVLSFVLNNTMRLLHPIEPFITEEVWLTIPHDGQTIVTASWPDLAEIPVDRQAAQDFEALQRAVERLRNLRADIGLQPRDVLALQVPVTVSDAVASLLASPAYTMGKVEPVDGVHGESLAEALDRVAGLAPKGVLADRYKKEAVRLRAEVERGEGKLANERFVANAKPDVVAKEREKLEGYRAELARVEAALKGMGL
jgi:valyl-tRNA synthetase